jgi:secreted trypsin-like serine protease
VSLHLNNRHACSGTILSDSFILTSSECVSFFNYNYDITIVVGIHRLSETVTVSRKVDEVYLHASYSSA